MYIDDKVCFFLNAFLKVSCEPEDDLRWIETCSRIINRISCIWMDIDLSFCSESAIERAFKILIGKYERKRPC
jgi:hypothetical protein